MEKRSRKEIEREVRKNYIIEAAEKLFTEKDFESTSMDEIAAEAQLSKTTVYKYVKSKDELALLVYIKINDIKYRELKLEMDKKKTVVNKLRTFAIEYFNFYKKYPQYLKFQLQLDYKGLNRENINLSFENYSTFFEEGVKYIVDIYNQGKADGSLKKKYDAITTLDLFYLTLRSVMNQVLIIDSNQSIPAIDDTSDKNYFLFVDLFIDSIKK